MGAAEIAVAKELIADAERADGPRPMSDHLWLDLAEGGRPGFAGLLAMEQGHEHPVAYCQVSKGSSSWAIELVVHPHHRYDMTIIGPEMLHAATKVIAEEGGGRTHWWVFEPTAIQYDIATSAGFKPGRRLLQLRCHLPLSDAIINSARHVETRDFVPGKDDVEWLALNNAAFSTHPEQGGWDQSVLNSRMKQAWFDPTGFRILETDHKMTGFCWTKIHHDTDPVMGEIYVIGINPTTAGTGLGTALTIAGLQSIASRGVDVGMLYVDADNHAAMKMYRNLGFEVHRTDVAFVGDF
jgi:mycothiol synthase